VVVQNVLVVVVVHSVIEIVTDEDPAEVDAIVISMIDDGVAHHHAEEDEMTVIVSADLPLVEEGTVDLTLILMRMGGLMIIMMIMTIVALVVMMSVLHHLPLGAMDLTGAAAHLLHHHHLTRALLHLLHPHHHHLLLLIKDILLLLLHIPALQALTHHPILRMGPRIHHVMDDEGFRYKVFLFIRTNSDKKLFL